MKMTTKQKRAIWYAYRENAIEKMHQYILKNKLYDKFMDFRNNNIDKYIRYKNLLNAFFKMHNLPIITTY